MNIVTETEDRWAVRLVCSRTGVTAPLDEPAFLSPAGAPWLVDYELDAAKGERLKRALPGRPGARRHPRTAAPGATPRQRSPRYRTRSGRRGLIHTPRQP